MNKPVNAAGFDVRPGDILAAIRMNVVLVAAFTAAVFLVVLVGTLLTTPQYRSTALLELVPKVPQEVDVDEVVENDIRSFQEIERFYRTQLQIIQTRTIAEQVLVRYNELGHDDMNPEEHVGKLRGMLTVFPRERSRIIELTIVDTDATRAAVLANLYARVYVEKNLEARREASREAKQWLETKLEEYQVRVDEASGAMLDYKASVELADAEERETTLSRRLVTLDVAYGEVSTERVLLQTEVDANRALLASGQHAELAKVLATPLLETLSRQYSEAWTEHATLATRYGEKHPDLKESKAKLDRISAQLEEQVERSVAAQAAQLELLQSKETSLVGEIERTKGQLLAQQRLQAEYAQLKLEYSRSEQFLKRLSERSDELDLSARTQLNNARIIEEARPPKSPFKPRMFLNLALAMFMGLVGGVLLAFLRYWVDDTIRSPLEITGHFDLPLLGAITRASPKLVGEYGDLVTHHRPNSLVSEAARGVWTLMHLRPTGEPVRRVLVTSSLPSEGKTATCVRLGIAGSQFGKRVVVVDVDHRRARLHKVFGLANEVGLTSYLTGRATADEVAIATEVPGLHAVPLGPRVDNVGQFLVGAAMERLLDELQERFDLVILDTPPAAGLTEPVNLSKMVDGVVFVIRAGAVSRVTLGHTLERFHQVGSTILGAVLNVVDDDHRGSGGYLYGYRYYQYYNDGYRDPDDREAAAK